MHTLKRIFNAPQQPSYRSAVAALLLFLTCSFPVTACAHDLGVNGTIYPIEEQDMRQALVESAARANWDKVRSEREASAENYLDTLPRRHLPVAKHTTTTWHDPSITLSSDIRIPVRNSMGTYDWHVLYHKGQRVNPLRDFRPQSAMLFFDGGKPDQLAFVKAVLAAYPVGVEPVETSGLNPEKVSKLIGRPVFSANDRLLARFSIQQLPSLLHVGDGQRALLLGVTTFAAPYTVASLRAVLPAHLINVNAKASQ